MATTVRRAKGDVPKNLILGIDAGLTRTKAALFDAAGREAAAEGVSNEISRAFPGSAERSMDDAWMDAAKAIRGVLAAASATGADVAAVGVTGAMVGVWPVDDDGRPVRPAVLVADTRGQEAIDRVKTSHPSAMERIFRSDGCVVEPGCTLPALRWLFDHEPAVMARARHVLTCKDWLRFRLTGELAADVTEAAVAPGDARARDRSLEMLRLFGLESQARLFPPVRQSEIDRRLRHRSGRGGDGPARGNAGRDRRRRRAVQRDRGGRSSPVWPAPFSAPPVTMAS